MYTYGYLREATMAHIDLDESETQAMNLLARFHIFANEAIQAICSVKPKYLYFEPIIVNKFNIVVRKYNQFDGASYLIEADEDELYYLEHGQWPPHHDPLDMSFPVLADDTDTIEFYHNKNIYIVGEQVKMPNDFIAFAQKQCYYWYGKTKFDKEAFVNGFNWDTCDVKDSWLPIFNENGFRHTENNTLTFDRSGRYRIPYKALWFVFTSDMQDEDELDIPMDVFICIPLYLAAQALQIDYAQKAQIKRQEFELALARVTETNKMPVSKIMPLL